MFYVILGLLVGCYDAEYHETLKSTEGQATLLDSHICRGQAGCSRKFRTNVRDCVAHVEFYLFHSLLHLHVVFLNEISLCVIFY